MEKNYWITHQPIEVNDVIQKVVRREAGAISTFIGAVREFTDGKRTLYLQYQAYESMAEKKLAQIGAEIEAQWECAHTAIAHRIGTLAISDIAVAIAVSTPHRTEAFQASRYAIDRIKEIVPIWKKEYWEDGSMWIGDQKERVSYLRGTPSEEEMKNG
ncbi:MAG TPA: molybdenum cofactor biosynthesis protein MoaE [Bacillota bacterium]